MGSLLRALLFLALICAFSLWLAEKPGFTQIEWLDYRATFPTSLLMGLVALLAVFLLLFGQALGRLLTWPRRKRTERRLAETEIGLRSLTRAATALALSNHELAAKELTRARRRLPDLPLLVLMEAQCLEKQGKREQATLRYEALSNYEDTAAIGVRGLLQSAEKQKDYARALSVATEGVRQFPKDMTLLTHSIALMLKNGDAESAEAILRKWRTRWQLSRSERLHLLALAQVVKARHAIDNTTLCRYLALGLALQPSHPYIPLAHIAALLSEDTGAALRQVKSLWQKHPTPPLTALALEVITLLPEEKRARTARKIANLAPEHLESHILRAQEAMGRHDYFGARAFAQSAITLRESRRALSLMAEIESELGGQEAAKSWFGRASIAPAEEQWICESCDHYTHGWHLFCPHCDALDSMKLQLPADAVAEIVPSA
jgi:HemY protein